MNILKHPQACGCPTSECDGLTCGWVICTTAQDLSVNVHHTINLDPDGCAQAQTAPKVHHCNVDIVTDGCAQAQAASMLDHSNKLSGTKQGCLLQKQN